MWTLHPFFWEGGEGGRKWGEGGEEGGEPPTKFSKRGKRGLDRTSTLKEGLLEKREVTFFRRGVAIFAKKLN